MSLIIKKNVLSLLLCTTVIVNAAQSELDPQELASGLQTTARGVYEQQFMTTTNEFDKRYKDFQTEIENKMHLKNQFNKHLFSLICLYFA